MFNEFPNHVQSLAHVTDGFLSFREERANMLKVQMPKATVQSGRSAVWLIVRTGTQFQEIVNRVGASQHRCATQ
jgi:hypothetical protein